MANFSHYYKFAELFHGRRLVRDPNHPDHFQYAGEPVVVDEQAVYDLQPNQNMMDIPADTIERQQATRFAAAYAHLLNRLHDAFNGAPAGLQSAVDIMFELKQIGEELVQMVNPVTGRHIGLVYNPQ